MVSCFLCCRCFSPFCSQPVYFWVLLLSIYCCFLSIKKKKKGIGALAKLRVVMEYVFGKILGKNERLFLLMQSS